MTEPLGAAALLRLLHHAHSLSTLQANAEAFSVRGWQLSNALSLGLLGPLATLYAPLAPPVVSAASQGCA